MTEDTFELCPKYKRDDLDFDEIQRDKNNPLDKQGYPIYPILMPSNQGSSFTYKVSDDWFFKRKLQDGGHPHTILSQHHFNQAYNELYGTFDDLGEVIAYILSKSIKDPDTGKAIVNVPEYRLATYLDKDKVLLRGCVSKNVCENKNQRLVPISYLLSNANLSGTSADVYMKAIETYVSRKGFICDYESVRRTLIKDSFFNWKIANSDNHKNNILLLIETLPGGKSIVDVCPLIDNGSAYELSVRYKNEDDEIRLEPLFTDDDFSRVDEEGNRVLSFSYYPYMHNAFSLDGDTLLINDTKIADKNYSYEYGLASEMLTDKELYKQIYEINRQLSPETAINEINETYGTSRQGAPKSINWPPYLKEFMIETNNLKSKVISYVVADYYLKVASNALIDNKKQELLNDLQSEFLNIPLQESKDAYDSLFVEVTRRHGVKVDETKLKNLAFKKELVKSKPESNE